MKTTGHTRSTAALAALALSFTAVAASALVANSAAVPSRPTSGCSGPYGWPVKPFDRQHPIRGNFGDPRMVFDGRRSQKTIDAGDGSFSFHHGVDISAPDGTPVYAVASGTITRTHGDRVTVVCGTGRRFEYWHLTVTVRVGQHAVARTTVLGRILPGREHVHLTQRESGRPVNPLGPGRLTPYRDTTRPTILGITLRRRDLGRAVGPMEAATGRVYAYAEAIDMPAIAVPGRWNGFPVTPALVTWRLETSRGRTIVAASVSRDVRRIIPSGPEFWSTFARGSYQNWPVFTNGRARGKAGRYIFRLSTRPLDLDRLPDGMYRLVVTVSDSACNRSTSALAFRVDTC
jgi:hypothetical protein